MAEHEDLWIPLVDEPIGQIVERVLQDEPKLRGLVSSPHRILAFRTFAYIRVGVVLGELLFDHDLPPYDGSEEWVDELLANQGHRAAIVKEVRAVAEEISADPKYAEDEPLGPDDETRARFREFARKRLETG
jgi:hypothetical protein